jgi:hypothetical protein
MRNTTRQTRENRTITIDFGSSPPRKGERVNFIVPYELFVLKM